LGRVFGSEIVLCVGQYGVGLGESVFGVCGTVWGGFGVVILYCVWESLGRVWGSEFEMCLGEFGICLGE